MIVAATTTPWDTSRVRTFPLRTAPVPGESLDSWLEATAARFGVNVRTLYKSMGFHPPFKQLWRRTIVELSDTEAAAIAAATGCTVGQVRSFTLSGLGALAGIVDSGWFAGGAPWSGIHGSRFCPYCLAETGGAWQLRWRLVWAFTCVRHGCLLADRCPRCGGGQRFCYRPGAMVAQPGQCANPAPGAAAVGRQPLCDADLGQAPVITLAAEHPALTAQATIDRLIDSEIGDFGIYAEHPLPSTEILTDIRALGKTILNAVNVDELDRVVAAADLVTDYRASIASLNSPLQMPSSSTNFRQNLIPAVSTAVAVIAALNVLNCRTIDAAADAFVELRGIGDDDKLVRGIWAHRLNSGSTSPVLRAVHMRTIGPRLNPAEQLQCRVGTVLPGRPANNRTIVERRAARIPALIWPTLALRLCPPTLLQRPARAALSVALLLVGASTTIADAAAALGNASIPQRVSKMLHHLSQTPCWGDIRSVIVRLSDYLDTANVPIDYQRRRQLEYAELLPRACWTDMAHDNFAHPNAASRARAFLQERISGSPTTPAPPEFWARLNPGLLSALDDYAANFLATQGVTGEPVCWEPPKQLLIDVELPGIDIDVIDSAALHRLIRRDRPSLHTAASVMGITTDAARCVLECHPVPTGLTRITTKPSVAANRPAPSYRRASAMFPRDKFVELHHEQRRSLRSMATQAGVSVNTIRKLMHGYGIRARDTAKIHIDPDWFYAQHIDGGRSLRELARELDVAPTSLCKWAKKHRVPVRRLERHSREELRANRAIPHLLVPALAGIGGWERLQRFADTARYSNYVSAARELQVRPGTLAHQVELLERDFGKRLIERAHNERPMHLTLFGHEVLRAVTHLSAAGGP